MKKLLTLLLALVMVLGIVPMAFAAEIEETAEPTEIVRAPDECGEGITWEFDGGVLYIRGDGAMDDFEEGKEPWRAHKDKIEEVLIEGKLTYIGAYAFKDYDALLAVGFGDALYEIGKEAFRSCDGLSSIWLPESFKIFGEASFQSCKNLKEIHCAGRFPSFRQNSMWDTYVTIYYPAAKPWDVELIAQLEEAFKGRIQFLASDGTDHYVPTEPTEEPEETVPETTVPVTEAPETEVPETEVPAETQAPVTEAPATEAATEATSEPAEDAQETVPATEPEAEEAPETEKGGFPWGLAIVGAVLAGLGIGFLIFGGKKGKYQR